jgi:hypothetical protein
MSVFDLLFLLLFLTSLATLIAGAAMSLRGNHSRALRIVKRWAVCAALYLAIVYTVAFARPRRFLSVGDERCFDDWCMAVENATHTASGADLVYDVTLRVSSRAKRASQRANGTHLYLTDALGRRFDPDPDAAETPLNVLLQAGESRLAHRTFRVPGDARDVGLVLVHGMGVPVCLIIGDEACLADKRPVVRLP